MEADGDRRIWSDIDGFGRIWTDLDRFRTDIQCGIHGYFREYIQRKQAAAPPTRRPNAEKTTPAYGVLPLWRKLRLLLRGTLKYEYAWAIILKKWYLLLL